MTNSNETLFEKLNYIKPSSQLINTIDWIHYIVQIITTVVFIILIYIVCWKSPKKLKDYKWFIMINSTIGYFVIPATNIAHFEVRVLRF